MITAVRHPYYAAKSIEWEKWRYVYNGGEDFINKYLEKFSEREDDSDYKRRKRITPTPNFAKAAVNDVKNSIFQRLTDVNRRDGSSSYQAAIRGDDFGVDLHGSSMNSFIGRELLIELLTMSRIGVFVDMPRIDGATLRDAVGKRPYLYTYRAEDILSWNFRPGRPDEFDNLLVRDHVEVCHEISGLPEGVKERYRHMRLNEDGVVEVTFWETYIEPETGNKKERQIDINGEPTATPLILNINVIPFTLIELSDSLLSDVSNHQIALLNMESSDINYALKSNFPFYTEEDGGHDFSHLNQPAEDGDGTAAGANKGKPHELKVGAVHGRRYGKGLDRPGFIHPSSEPIKASMEKQASLKDDIRTLINLSLSNIKPKMASAESKSLDERGLEAGLSNIGLVLEHGERKIAHYWAMYGGEKVATVKYPEKWSLRTDEDRRQDAKSLRELRDTIPSSAFQRNVSKEIAQLLLGDKVSNEQIDQILKEIDDAESYTADPETIFQAVDRGILDLETAAVILGWPKEVVEKAAKDHADRLARIAAAQQPKNDSENQPPPIADLDGSPQQSERDEKSSSKDRTADDDTKDKVRGEGREEAQL